MASLSGRLLSYGLAVRRKLSLWATGDFHPYPTPPADVALSPSQAHAHALTAIRPALACPGGDGASIREWQVRARQKLAELSGYQTERPQPRVLFADDSTRAGLRMRRLYLRIAPDTDVPVTLLWRDGITTPAPAMICLQGTNSGFHLNWGEIRMPADHERASKGLDFGRQAASRGYVAVCIEQSCFGERQERAIPRSANATIDAANHALLLGRTLVGERATDVSSVVDWLLQSDGMPVIDTGRIYVLGNSAGGTTAVHAAALDERIAGVVASGCVGFIRDTIARRRDGGGQNVIPGILKWLEMDGVVALTAPRPFLAVSGTRDHIFPFAGAAAVVESARAAYRALGADHAITSASAEGPHRFYPDVAWIAFERLVGGASS